MWILPPGVHEGLLCSYSKRAGAIYTLILGRLKAGGEGGDRG